MYAWNPNDKYGKIKEIIDWLLLLKNYDNSYHVEVKLASIISLCETI